MVLTSLTDWQTLFAVQAGAAATLTGLVFVAVSINLVKIVSYPGLPSRAAESILQFLQIFFICIAALMPRQPVIALGIEILVISVFSWVMQVVAHIRYGMLRTGHPRLWLIIRIVQTQLANIPFFIAGTILLVDSPAGPYFLVLGFTFSLIAGVANAWVLLVEVVR